VPDTVIDGLEVVDPDVHQVQSRTEHPALREALAEPVDEQHPVRQPGEPVVESELGQPLVGLAHHLGALLALGDVVVDAAQAESLAG
jgi:hypothetical protein